MYGSRAWWDPTVVYPGMLIGKIQYFPLIGDPSIEYRGKYFKQIEPTESRLSEEYTGESRVKKYVNKRWNKKTNGTW